LTPRITTMSTWEAGTSPTLSPSKRKKMSNKEMTAEQFFQQLLEDALWHETHKPEPAPWKGKVLERLIAQEGK
jgi:hypothetical protein